MPYLDIRYLTSSSLIPTSIIYYNNYNNKINILNQAIIIK
jgi:hypothetical protein